VVGSGTARLLTDNKAQTERFGGDEINIKYILDLRDFPDSPFADKIVHDYNIILSDPEVSVVIEVMGGSHPAYEFTVSALKSGKSVITSNKEVVANFGDEFLRIASENGVCYRFEASVGGGIPVISPMLSCVGQNKITEVRGILNGTTNFILTQMFTYGQSFESALADAQARGYAERNPDADILGTDACRKISILSAIVSGELISTENIHTEGITAIRPSDVVAAEKMGATIKLVGRGIFGEGKPLAMVAPSIVPLDMPLGSVRGVYNAIEVVGEPIGNVMFYGQGAGAGATASAVVGDLMQIMREGTSSYAPSFNKFDGECGFDSFVSKHYIALGATDKDKLLSALPESSVIENGDEFAVITPMMSEADIASVLKAADLSPLSHIRVLA
jgi:homoserine dehydrogenase